MVVFRIPWNDPVRLVLRPGEAGIETDWVRISFRVRAPFALWHESKLLEPKSAHVEIRVVEFQNEIPEALRGPSSLGPGSVPRVPAFGLRAGFQHDRGTLQPIRCCSGRS